MDILKMAYVLSVALLTFSPLASNQTAADTATDPVSWMTCEEAVSESESDWYPGEGSYTQNIQAKLAWCDAQTPGDAVCGEPGPEPVTWLTCDEAIAASQESWFPNPGAPYSDNVQLKLDWCNAQTLPDEDCAEPVTWLTCNEAIAASLESWFPNPGAPYSDNVQLKLDWCNAQPIPPIPQPTAGLWPGTQTRFYPGIYVHTEPNNPTPQACEDAYNTMFGERGDKWIYRDADSNQKSYLGCFIQVELKQFYVDEYKAPSAYASNCSRSDTAQNPNWDNYNWEYLEEFLDLPIVKEGGAKIYLQLQGTYAAQSPLPSWMHAQEIGYSYPSVYDGRIKWSLALWRRQTQYALMDFGHALATRFKNDERLAAIHLPESFPQGRSMPSDYPANGNESSSACGLVGDLNKGNQAMHQGRIFQAHGLKEGDPNLLVIVMNAASSIENGYLGNFTDKDIPLTWGDKPEPDRWGLKDLPGQWGVATNGALMFQKGCGSKPFGDLDCTSWSLSNIQNHAIANDRVVSVDSQGREWIVDTSNLGNLIDNSEEVCCRQGSSNPWNYSWDDWLHTYAFWKAQGGKYRYIPTPAEWVWYYSGEPKKEGPAADSGLGQYGMDPGGVIPAHYFVVRNLPTPPMVEPGDQSNVIDTRTAENYAEAFDTFGPQGTGAMISFPEGY